MNLQQVAVQHAISAELFVAYLACKRFGAGVSLHVNGEMGALAEALMAFFALVRLFASVGPDVHRKSATRAEGFVAPRVVALIRLFPGVCPHVTR